MFQIVLELVTTSDTLLSSKKYDEEINMRKSIPSFPLTFLARAAMGFTVRAQESFFLLLLLLYLCICWSLLYILLNVL